MIWSKTTICRKDRHVTTTKWHRKNLHTRSYRRIPLLCKISRLHNALRPCLVSITTGNTNSKHNEKSKTISRLCSIQPRCSGDLQSKQPGTSSTQLCIVSIWNQSMQQSRRPFLLIWKWNLPRKQRSRTNRITNNQRSHVISSRSWNWSTLNQLAWNRPTTTYTRGNCPSATTNPNTNRQHHSTRSRQTYNPTKMNQSRGNAFPLDNMQKKTKKFRTYWGEGKTNYGGYTTENHPIIHHQATRSLFLTSKSKLEPLKARATGIIIKIIPTARVC